MRFIKLSMIKRTITLLGILIFLCIPAQATLKFLAGFESNSIEGAEGVGAPAVGNGSVTAVASPVKSGSYAMKATTASASFAYQGFYTTDTAGSVSSSFQQLTFQFQVGTLPGTTSNFITWQCAAPNYIHLKIDTSGHLLFGSNSAADGSASSGTITADGAWHSIQVKLDASSSDVKVDGTSWATYSTTASGCNVLLAGVSPNNIADTTATYYFDDLIGGDDGTAYIPVSQLLFLPVVSDSARGSWVGGAGGTTNLYDAMNNIPPVGKTMATATNTSQIKNITSGGNQDGTFNVTDYTTGGVPAGATIDFVALSVAGGPGTNVNISVGLWIASNPTQGAASTTRFTNGGVGTYGTRWRPGIGTIAMAPSVTLGTKPTITIRKVTSTTNGSNICWAGIYVGYTPASGCSQSIALMGVGCR